ncbi:MAG: hypothetical protein GY910_15910 [bacterium]|nr:hypothetical protein [bacterium]
MSDESKEADQPVELGPIATRVLYEDARVRVWEQVIEPGGSIGPQSTSCPTRS